MANLNTMFTQEMSFSSWTLYFLHHSAWKSQAAAATYPGIFRLFNYLLQDTCKINTILLDKIQLRHWEPMKGRKDVIGKWKRVSTEYSCMPAVFNQSLPMPQIPQKALEHETTKANL